MNRPLLLPMPGNEAFAGLLARQLDADLGELSVRRFPDLESYVRIDSEVAGRQVAIVASLKEPDPLFLPLFYTARRALDLGAARVGLVAPYLAYMRQDIRFRPGEAVSSIYFARLLSSAFSWLVTVDPHLHRWKSLDEIYSLDSEVVHAAPDIAEWVLAQVESPLLIGPDCESEQWVAAIADRAKAPFTVLEKIRRGDRDVTIAVPDLNAYRGSTPVLIDDMISTAQTLITVLQQWPAGFRPMPLCIAVHGLFAEGAHADLIAAGASRVVTTNTVPHETSLIDVSARMAEAIRRKLA